MGNLNSTIDMILPILVMTIQEVTLGFGSESRIFKKEIPKSDRIKIHGAYHLLTPTQFLQHSNWYFLTHSYPIIDLVFFRLERSTQLSSMPNVYVNRWILCRKWRYFWHPLHHMHGKVQFFSARKQHCLNTITVTYDFTNWLFCGKILIWKEKLDITILRCFHLGRY